MPPHLEGKESELFIDSGLIGPGPGLFIVLIRRSNVNPRRGRVETSCDKGAVNVLCGGGGFPLFSSRNSQSYPRLCRSAAPFRFDLFRFRSVCGLGFPWVCAWKTSPSRVESMLTSKQSRTSQ